MPTIFSSRSSPGGIFLGCVSLVAVTSLCILVSTPTTEGLLQEQYVGCFYDESPMSDVHVTGAISTDEALTIEKCIGKCLELNTTYAALQNRRVCHCRDEYGVQHGQPESTCNFDCSGNNSEICGGFIGQQIAYSLYTVCPIGSYGAECDKGCHCKHDTPCDRIIGFCSDGCYGNWSGSACNITTVSHQYIGCYQDRRIRALELWINPDGDDYNTIKTCTTSCVERNYTYAGLQVDLTIYS